MKGFAKLFCLFSLLALSLNTLAAEIPVYTEDQTQIQLKNSKAFTLKLQSNPTTGYSWALKKFDKRFIELVGHQFQAAENRKLMGAPGFEYWTFKLKGKALSSAIKTSLHFSYARPWEKKKPAKELVFELSTAKA